MGGNSSDERVEHRLRTLREFQNNQAHNNVRNGANLPDGARRDFERAVEILCDDVGRINVQPDVVRNLNLTSSTQPEPMDNNKGGDRTHTISHPPAAFIYNSSSASEDQRSNQSTRSQSSYIQRQLDMQATRIQQLEQRNEELRKQYEEEPRLLTSSTTIIRSNAPKDKSVFDGTTTSYSSSTTMACPPGQRVTSAPAAAAFPPATEAMASAASSSTDTVASQMGPTSSTATDLTQLKMTGVNESTIMPPSENVLSSPTDKNDGVNDTMTSETQRFTTARASAASGSETLSAPQEAVGVTPEPEKRSNRRRTTSLTDSEVNRIVDATRRGDSNPFSLSDNGSDAEVYIEEEISPADFDEQITRALERIKDGGQETIFSVSQIGLWLHQQNTDETSARERRKLADTMALLLVYLTPIIKDNYYPIEARTEAVRVGRALFTKWKELEKKENRIYTANRVARNQERLENLRQTGIAGDDTINDMISHGRQNLERADTAPDPPRPHPNSTNPFDEDLNE